MLLGPKDSYLCYIPKPVESASTKRVEEPEADPTPARSWSLLQPLAGSCLYVSLVRSLYLFSYPLVPSASARLVHVLLLS